MQDACSEGAADILIPVCNHYRLTRTSLEGIYRHADYPFHIYVVDNASTDETADLHKIYTRDITIIRNRRSRGWSAAINQGIQMGSNPYVIFLKNGVELSHGWLRNLIAFLNTHPRIAAVGPLNSGKNDRQGVDQVRKNMVPEIPHFLTEDIHERNRILQYHFLNTGILVDEPLTFFCTAFARREIEDVGLLAGMNGEDDIEYCRRLRKAGYVLGLALDTYVVRHTQKERRPAVAARKNPLRKRA